VLSELTSPRVDENLTQNILAQLDPPEPIIKVVDAPSTPPHGRSGRKRSIEREEPEVPVNQDGDTKEPNPEPLTDEQPHSPENLILEPPLDLPEEVEAQEVVLPVDEPEQQLVVEEVQEVEKPPRLEPMVRSRKTSAAHKQSSNKADLVHTKGDQSQHSGQANQSQNNRAGKKVTTPQNRVRNQRNRKYSRSDDEESGETFVPKHHLVSQQTNSREPRNAYPPKGAERREPSEDSEPEYKVKEPQNPSKPINDQNYQRQQSREDSASIGKDDGSMAVPRARRPAEAKANPRVEQESSPKRTKDKKRGEMRNLSRLIKMLLKLMDLLTPIDRSLLRMILDTIDQKSRQPGLIMLIKPNRNWSRLANPTSWMRTT
jgi:hypothetical protein